MEKNINIPKGWKEYRLEEVAEIHDGLRKPINASERAARIVGKNQTDLYPYYGATGQVGCIDGYISDGEYVLVGEDGAPFFNPFANKAYIIRGKAWVNNHAHILKAKGSNKYICYYLNYFNYHGYVSGTTRLKLTQADLKKIPVLIPSTIAEQSAIVSRIESQFSRLDSGIAALQKVQKQLAVYRQAVLNKYLTINNTQWEYVPIYDVIKIINSGSTPKSNKMYSSGEIQFLKVYNLTFDGTINLSKDPVFIDRETHESLLKRSRAKAGDVLINIVGPPLGKVSIIPDVDKEFNINQAIVMFRPNELVLSKFLAYYLMSPQVIAWLTSTSKATAGQHNVKVSTCRELMFPKVPILEQTRIVEHIESRLSVCNSIEKTVSESLRQADVLRQSILKEAFEGRL